MTGWAQARQAEDLRLLEVAVFAGEEVSGALPLLAEEDARAPREGRPRGEMLMELVTSPLCVGVVGAVFRVRCCSSFITGGQICSALDSANNAA